MGWAKMLAPPPQDQSVIDKTALEPEGRRQYLQSLENRLKKLEGRDGKLTSKDMLSALSEARDDHLTAPQDSSMSSYVNEYAELEGDNNRVSTFTCCCWGGRRYLRVGSNRQQTGQFDMEEYSCLVDCDELELTQQRNTEQTNNDHGTLNDNPSSQTSSNNVGFDDNFVANY